MVVVTNAVVKTYSRRVDCRARLTQSLFFLTPGFLFLLFLLPCSFLCLSMIHTHWRNYEMITNHFGLGFMFLICCLAVFTHNLIQLFRGTNNSISDAAFKHFDDELRTIFPPNLNTEDTFCSRVRIITCILGRDHQVPCNMILSQYFAHKNINITIQRFYDNWYFGTNFINDSLQYLWYFHFQLHYVVNDLYIDLDTGS